MFTAWYGLVKLTICDRKLQTCRYKGIAAELYTALTGQGLVRQTSRQQHTASRPLLSPLKSSDHYMYYQFNIQQFYVLPTRCTDVFCVDLRTNSDYFPTLH